MEETIVHCLNNKAVKDLNNNLKYQLKQMFGPLDEDEIVTSIRLNDFIKPDISITYKGITKFVSIKTGRARQIHTERCDLFANYLKSKGVAKEQIDFYLLWHFGDGTTDGNGDTQIGWLKMVDIYFKERIEFNKKMNEDKNFLVQIIDRFLFQGSNPFAIAADFIYLGDEDFGITVSRNMVRKYILNSTFSYLDNPHIGPVQFRSHHTKKGFNEREINARFKTDFWWAGLEGDLRYIAKRFCD